MLLLQKIFLFSLLALLFPQTPTNNKQELNDQLFEAVRKGDAAAVTALLDKGADVNAKFRYGATALFKAAERGQREVANILLERGADMKVKDTFYQRDRDDVGARRQARWCSSSAPGKER